MRKYQPPLAPFKWWFCLCLCVITLAAKGPWRERRERPAPTAPCRASRRRPPRSIRTHVPKNTRAPSGAMSECAREETGFCNKDTWNDSRHVYAQHKHKHTITHASIARTYKDVVSTKRSQWSNHLTDHQHHAHTHRVSSGANVQVNAAIWLLPLKRVVTFIWQRHQRRIAAVPLLSGAWFYVVMCIC